jgi:hypothetical protein
MLEPTSPRARGEDPRLDFTRPFLPGPLAGAEGLDFLSPVERLTLNQIRARAYLGLLELVEEAFLPLLLDRSSPLHPEDEVALSALRQGLGRRARHVQTFRRFRESFDRGFGSPCRVIGSPVGLERTVLLHDPFAAALALLHAECMTGRHHTAGLGEAGTLDPQWSSLLEHHGKEEAEHARRDAILLAALAERRSPLERAQGVGEYLSLVELLDAVLEQQVQLDLESLARAAGRALSGPELEAFLAVQRRANRWTYLGSGLTHPSFLLTLERLGGAARERVERAAAAFL